MNAPTRHPLAPAAAPLERGEPREIIVVGGGFAGASFARRLRNRLPKGYRLTVVSEESYTTFNPMLAEVVGASIFPEQVVAPLRQILRPGEGARFIMGRVTKLDFAAREIECATLSGEARLRYDQLVLAFGNVARDDFIPGLSEHALPLKTVGDALEIRNAVLRRLARIELEQDRELRRALGHFSVIGGGFSGVEVAGELTDFLRRARRYYPGVAADELRVTLIQDIGALLPELPRRLGEAAAASLRRRGLEVRFGARAARINADSVEFADGSRLATRCVITTAGVRPNPVAAQCGLPLERGRIVVDWDMSVAGVEGVWALGDCAAVRNARNGDISPPTAQFAVREGRQLADNLLRALRGAPTRPFRYQARGMMASIGRFNGVAQVFGVSFSGLSAWLLWRAYYLGQMPTLGRKVRIFVEWTWGMVFPADITHFHFTRSKERP